MYCAVPSRIGYRSMECSRLPAEHKELVLKYPGNQILTGRRIKTSSFNKLNIGRFWNLIWIFKSLVQKNNYVDDFVPL